MGRKKSNKKKGQGAAKTAEKTAKAEKKALKKELGEDDIDTLLADLRVRDAAQSAISIAPCDAPSPRSGATWIAHPTKPELILFGGELYDGRTTSVYNDLLIFNLQKKEWRKVSSATCPPPRSAHQAVVVDRAEAPEMWIFGGEFTSPSGNQFHHYRDLWKLDLNTFASVQQTGRTRAAQRRRRGPAAAQQPVQRGAAQCTFPLVRSPSSLLRRSGHLANVCTQLGAEGRR